MPTTMLPYLLPGEQVTLNNPLYRGQMFAVVRTKRTRAHIVPADDLTATGWDARLSDLVAAVDGLGCPLPRLDMRARDAATTATEGTSARPRPAMVIRMNRPYRHWTTQDLMVILSVNQTTVTAVKLGGENNPGVRIPFNGFTVVDTASLVLAS